MKTVTIPVLYGNEPKPTAGDEMHGSLPRAGDGGSVDANNAIILSPSHQIRPRLPIGLGTERNLQVERELRRSGCKPSRIVHSYGQGGAEWSLSFDASEVPSLV